MKLDKATQILKRHNEWRRGEVIEMEHPTELGIAIDTILGLFENPHEQIVNFLIINTIGLNEANFNAYMEKMCEMKGIEYNVKNDIQK